MKKRIILISTLVWPIAAFYISLYLYNIWFDTLDMIKYNQTYSPEFDQDKTYENFIFWSFIIASIVVELTLIVFYQSVKKKLNNRTQPTA